MGFGGHPRRALAVDHLMSGAALAAEWNAQPQVLLKSTDSRTWNRTPCVLPPGMGIRRIAIAPSSGFTAYYVAIYDARSGTGVLPLNRPEIWRSFNGGVEWSTSSEGLPPDLIPNALVVDEGDPRRALVALGGAGGGGVYITTDGGAHWIDLRGSNANALLSVPVLGLVVHPKNRNVIYAATTIGVFRGLSRAHPASPPTATWEPFDEGLPDGVDVSDICVNRATGILTIGTRGFGAFQRDINYNAFAPPAMLTVRDSVFDRGLAPSLDDLPDPEHPVPDPDPAQRLLPPERGVGLSHHLVQFPRHPDRRPHGGPALESDRVGRPRGAHDVPDRRDERPGRDAGRPVARARQAGTGLHPDHRPGAPACVACPGHCPLVERDRPTAAGRFLDQDVP